MAIRFHFLDWIDEPLTNGCRNLWGRSFLLDALMIVLAKWTPITMMALICIATAGVGLFHPTESIVHSVVSIISAIAARLINEPLSRFFHRLRPFEFDGFQPLLGHENGQSFPSNHATGAFALSVGYIGVPGYFGVLIVLAFLLSFSRVYVGLHHFTDVVAGTLHGAFIASICLAFFMTMN